LKAQALAHWKSQVFAENKNTPRLPTITGSGLEVSTQCCNLATGAPDGPTLARSSTAMSIATIFCFYREAKAGLNRGQR
jgi:hypothetical protein